MEAPLTAAARALSFGDALSALKWLGRRTDAPATAMRGAALSQLGEYVRGARLWHGTWEEDTTELRRVDPATDRVLETLEMPAGVSGLEANGDLLFCGGGVKTPVVRAVKRPSRK